MKLSAMDSIREEVLGALKRDFQEHGTHSILVEYLREKYAQDLRVYAPKLLHEDRLYELQEVLTAELLRNPKIKDLRALASLSFFDEANTQTPLRKANIAIRKKLMSDDLRLSRKQLHAIMIELEAYLPKSGRAVALLIEQTTADNAPERLALTAQLDRVLMAEAKQWLLDRGFSPSDRRTGNIRAGDIPSDLLANVLARHPEIRAVDNDFDAAQAYQLWLSLDEANVSSLVPIRIDALGGMGLYLICGPQHENGFYISERRQAVSQGRRCALVDVLVYLGKPSCREIICGEYLGNWLPNVRMNQTHPGRLPKRYELLFAEEQQELRARREQRKVRS